MNLENKKVLMIIAHNKFRDEEFEIPFNYLLSKGAKISVASSVHGTAKGMFGKEVAIDLTLSEVNEKDYNAVVFVGGQGTPDIRKEKRAIEIAKNSKNHDVIAAICWAPTILAKAEILKGKRATVWLGNDPEYSKNTDAVLMSYGAVFVDESVVIDGNVITGNGPAAAQKFAHAIAAQLEANQ